MIVRILGDGQYEVPKADLPAIEDMDSALVDGLDRSDESAFAGALADLIGLVRRAGKRLADDDPRSSEMLVSHEGSTLSEIKAMLAEGA